MKKVNSDVAYEAIRKKILKGEFPPGHPLQTEALSTLTKVSRTPVREALHRLESEGLVTIRPRLGASVTKMDLKEFRQMCELRLALEGHAAALAAVNHTQGELKEIGSAMEAMRVLTQKIISSKEEQPFMDELQNEDVRFHIAIMTAAKNDLMKREILRLHLVNRVVGAPGNARAVFRSKAESDENRRKVLASHEAIYDAIAQGAATAAKIAMEKHIQDIIDKWMRAFTQTVASNPRELTEEEMAYSG